MSIEGTQPGELARVSSAKDLAHYIRGAVHMPALGEIQDNRFAQELFAGATQRATVIGTALFGLDQAIGTDPLRRRELAVAKGQIVPIVKADRVYALTQKALQAQEVEVPSILIEAEALPEDQRPQKNMPFRLDGRRYGTPDGTILRLLYLANMQFSLSFDTILSLIDPEIFSKGASRTRSIQAQSRSVLDHSLPSLFRNFNPNFSVATAPTRDDPVTLGYYLLDSSPTVTHDAEALSAESIERMPKETIKVIINRRDGFIVVDGEPHPLRKRRDGSLSQAVEDGLALLDLMIQIPPRWFTTPDLIDLLEANSLERGIFSNRISHARDRLIELLNSKTKTIIEKRPKIGGSECRLSENFTIKIQETTEPKEVFLQNQGNDIST